jgi:hypothetical protein
MTRHERPAGLRGLARRLAYPVRRAVAPGALEVQGLVAQLRGEIEGLRGEVAALHARAGHIDARMDLLDVRNGELTEGLQEARRLNLRIAELTDVVTELVLPLHDREVGPAALRTLRPDTR